VEPVSEFLDDLIGFPSFAAARKRTTNSGKDT
jgi:hypothetical protein